MQFSFKNFFIFFIVMELSLACNLQKEDKIDHTIVTKWQENKRSAISITFDDGTINQFIVARPILNSINLPATFYIITGKIKGSKKGKFIGRPISEIINETKKIETNASNFFEIA